MKELFWEFEILLFTLFAFRVFESRISLIVEEFAL